MKKQILNIGKALSRAEQREVFGGDLQNEDGENGFCYSSTATCRTNTTKKCCAGSCQATYGDLGICMP